MSMWSKLTSKKEIEKTMESLKQNGINPYFVETGNEVFEKVLEIIPKGSEVFTMTSVTLESLGISKKINDSLEYNSVRARLNSLDRAKDEREMKKLGSSPEFAIGSVQAVSQDGKILIASNTGSQLAAYAYGAKKIIFVVGVQKIVKDIEQGMKRIYEHSLPLESERAKKAYGVSGSAVNKLLIINKEIQQDRITLIFVNEILGF